VRLAKAHEDLGDVPHQDRQPPDLSGMLHLDLLEAPPEINELHQLLTVVLGDEALGLRLH
jgi:hypothetical protein